MGLSPADRISKGNAWSVGLLMTLTLGLALLARRGFLVGVVAHLCRRESRKRGLGYTAVVV